MTMRGSGDDLWDEFVREFEKDNAVREPSAAERARQAAQQAARQAARQQWPPRRRSRHRLLLLSAAALLAAAGAWAYALGPLHPEPAAAPAPSATSAPAAASAAATAAPAGSPAATTAAPAGSSGGPGAAIPLSVFPKQVQGYSLVADVANPDCTGPDTVAPTLAGLITQSHGCLGVDLALYRDADGNQYDLALFTMKDPADIPHLLMLLGTDAENYQVAVQLPPEGSGLRALPADSGLVQDFSAYGRGMLVGMAQWSDGRTADFGRLSERLAPLTRAVIGNIPA
ncbi:hypothetical protein [Kitasatospora sp. NPDC088783]|uniref:hypothetical protein n=1 Tax=Kitasatospora sp. NPDC088783 TaxID=3364077 RepID=UPI00381DB407